jgi:hypothetical protein
VLQPPRCAWPTGHTSSGTIRSAATSSSRGCTSSSSTAPRSNRLINLVAERNFDFALLAEGRAGSDEEIREFMSGNICRCGAYPNIVAAIREAAGCDAGV